jgi:hypothetical protein
MVALKLITLLCLACTQRVSKDSQMQEITMVMTFLWSEVRTKIGWSFAQALQTLGEE